MILDIDNERIILKTSNSSLSYRLREQLKLYGFLIHDGNMVCDHYDDRKLERVHNFISNNCHDLKLGKNLTSLLNRIKSDKKQRKIKIDILNSFKEGNIEYKKYDQDFKNNLKNLIEPLKDHQIKASYFLNICGDAALFSVPGSGKTRCVLMYYKMLLKKNLVDHILIVGPLSSHEAWEDEYKKFFNEIPDSKKFVGGHPQFRKSQYREKIYQDLFLTTYQTLANDYNDISILLKNNRFLMILDEAHYIKGQESTWASAILSVCKWAKFRVALTGTPMPQKFSDLFNIFDFISPNKDIIDDISKERLLREYKKNNKEFVFTQLKQLVDPFFYRVRKKELRLCKQIKHEVLIDMNSFERKVYDAVKSRITDVSKDDKLFFDNTTYLSELQKGRMIRLRQIFSNVSLLTNTIKGYEEDLLTDETDLKSIVANYNEIEKPAKLEKLKDIVNQFVNQNKKLLIWSNFIGTVDLIVNEIFKMGYSVKKITGSTPPDIEDDTSYVDTRKSIKEEFNDPSSSLQFLVANPAACAEAISLHKACDTAVYYDLSYNCAQYLQSLDRIHRVGASEYRPSHYYFLKYKDTLEYKIFDKVQDKAEIMLDLIDSDYGIYSTDLYTVDDEVENYSNLFGE